MTVLGMNLASRWLIRWLIMRVTRRVDETRENQIYLGDIVSRKLLDIDLNGNV